MEEILRQTLLYDFYGELLTEHQKQVYEDVVLNDYSLREVADGLGISRQGVHDMVRRSGRLLEEYEGKLHLVERFVSLREQVGRIQRIAQEQSGNPAMEKIGHIAARILEEL
ncbi:MAG: YlxM family DNA-binding protein [Eubacteriales bacterium]|nr:YlxM family DNA-binding protein [Eubacteriales bacterium]